MDISWYGRTCFRLKGRAAAVFTDPLAKRSTYNGSGTAEIVTVSRRDCEQTSAVSAIKGDPMVFDAPGYYERNGILVTGVASRRADGNRNLMFAFEIDGLRVIHLGLPDAAPTRAMLDELGEIDVLLLPVGNPASFSPRMAVDVMSEIDPPVAIPMEFSIDGRNGLAGVDAFLKELGVTPEPQPMLRLTRAGIPSELTVMLLEARGQS